MTRAPIEAWDTQPVKGGSWQGNRPRRTPAQAPRPVGRFARMPGQRLADPALPQLPVPAPSPSLPNVAAAAAPHPGVPRLAQRLGFGYAKGRLPPLEGLSPLVHKTPQWHAACPARAVTDFLFERLQSFGTPWRREGRRLGHVSPEMSGARGGPLHFWPHAPSACSRRAKHRVTLASTRCPARALFTEILLSSASRTHRDLGGPAPCRNRPAAGWRPGRHGTPWGVPSVVAAKPSPVRAPAFRYRSLRGNTRRALTRSLTRRLNLS